MKSLPIKMKCCINYCYPSPTRQRPCSREKKEKKNNQQYEDDVLDEREDREYISNEMKTGIKTMKHIGPINQIHYDIIKHLMTNYNYK